ncbi:hypothetical protein SB748_26460 [Rhizobium sp. SIMBA_035]
MTKTDWPKAALTTEIMQALDEILRDWCVENGCETGSEKARFAAKSLLDWFEFGVTDRGDLERALRDDVVIDKSEKS